MPTPPRAADARPHPRAHRAARRAPGRPSRPSTSPAPTARARRSAMATALLDGEGPDASGPTPARTCTTVNERMARNGEPIDDDALAGVLTELALLEPLLDERPTRFELLTAAALRGSPTRPSTPWSSRWGSAARGTAPTWCTATWPCSPTSASTTPTCSADPRGDRGATRRGSSSPGAGSWSGRWPPDLVDIVAGRAERGRARPRVWVAGRDFGCAPTRSPSAAGS